MKRFFKFMALVLPILLVMICTGCDRGEKISGDNSGYTVYYLNAAGNQLVGSEYETGTTDKEALVQEFLSQLNTVPAELDCQTAMPSQVEKMTYRIENQVLHLYADANYMLMNSVREILCRAALTKTLTQIEGIEYLTIYCADQPITDGAGNPVGMLSASDFVDSIRDVNSFERTEMTLYFANETGDCLVAEKREVMRSSNTSVEKLIVEQLIEGPQTSGSYAVIPKEVKLLNVSVNDSVCSINFDASFLNNALEVREYIPIYSIVNSLTELSTVSRVQIRINGSEDAVFRDLIPLNTIFERNYEYIEGGKTN